jgi:hypothetical protein
MSLSCPKISDQPSVTARAARAANHSQTKDAVTALTAPDSTRDGSEPNDDTSSSPPSSSPQKPPSLPTLKVSPTGASNVTVWRMLCDATNEISVSICCVVTSRRYVSTVRKLTVFRTRGDPRRKQSQTNLLTVVNLCLIPGHPFGPRSFLFHA